MIVWGVCISFETAGLKSFLPANVPCPSWSRSHLAMSTTFELMEPAGPILSILRHGIGVALPSTSVWGVDRSSPFLNDLMVVLVDDIPIGLKILSVTKSSQLIPDTFATTWPAVRNIRF